MLELNWYESQNPLTNEKKWYVHQVPKQVVDISDIAEHMHEHNTPFTAGTIEGLLKDFVRCMREQLLSGNTVKIENLAIFKLTVESNCFDSPGDVCASSSRCGVQARIGSVGEDDRTKAAVKSVRLAALSTGKMMHKNLLSDVTLGWSTEAKALMDEERQKAEAGKV